MSRHRLDEVLARKKLAASKKIAVSDTKSSSSTASSSSSLSSSSSSIKNRDDEERNYRDERRERRERDERREREEREERREREEREERERKERREREERERKRRDLDSEEDSQDELSLSDAEDSPSYDDDVKEDNISIASKEDFSDRFHSNSEDEEEVKKEEKEIVPQKQETIDSSEAPLKRRGRPRLTESEKAEKVAEKVEKSEKIEKSVATKQEDEDILNKSSMVRLLKASGVVGLFADAIDSSKEILQQIIEELCDQSTTGVINIDLVNKNINRHFKNGENDLPQDVYISPSTWDRYAKSTTDKKGGITIRRDASFLLQLYCEGYLLKMVKAAEMVAASAKRTRISGGDLAIAYHIYTM